MKENYGLCYRDSEGVLWAWTFGRDLESVRKNTLDSFVEGENGFDGLMNRFGGRIVDVRLVEV